MRKIRSGWLSLSGTAHDIIVRLAKVLIYQVARALRGVYEERLSRRLDAAI